MRRWGCDKRISKRHKRSVKTVILLGSSLLMVTVCLAQQTSDIPSIILDTDMGSDCDDVGALAILHQYVNEDRANLLGVIYSSGRIPYGVGIIDGINTYFGRPDLPIGAEKDTLFGDPVDKMDAAKLAQDTTVFGHDMVSSKDVPHQVALARLLLSNQPDSSVTYVTIGHTKALHDLLQSPSDSISKLSGMQIVKKKMKKWVALGGLRANRRNPKGSKDWNFYRNGTAPFTDYLLEHFPRPVYIINAGSDVLTGQVLEKSASGNIIRTAYRDWLWKVERKLLFQGRPSWDLAAVCFAVEEQNQFFKKPEKGILHFDLEHGSKWESNSQGSHFYISQKENIAAEFGSYLNELLEKSVEP